MRISTNLNYDDDDDDDIDDDEDEEESLPAADSSEDDDDEEDDVEADLDAILKDRITSGEDEEEDDGAQQKTNEATSEPQSKAMKIQSKYAVKEKLLVRVVSSLLKLK